MHLQFVHCLLWVVCVPWVSAVGAHSLGARVVGRAFQSKHRRLMPPLGCGLAGVTRLYR